MEKNFCNKCGYKKRYEGNFCSNCGNNFSDEINDTRVASSENSYHLGTANNFSHLIDKIPKPLIHGIISTVIAALIYSSEFVLTHHITWGGSSTPINHLTILIFLMIAVQAFACYLQSKNKSYFYLIPSIVGVFGIITTSMMLIDFASYLSYYGASSNGDIPLILLIILLYTSIVVINIYMMFFMKNTKKIQVTLTNGREKLTN
jgi:hypothetical protein